MTDTEKRKAAAAAIFTAAAQGKTIQRIDDDERWYDADPFNSSHRWMALENPHHFRIKPEPVTRPWTAGEAIDYRVVKRKSDGRIGTLGIYPDGVAVCWSAFNLHSYQQVSYADLLRDFTTEDGSPCGTTEPTP